MIHRDRTTLFRISILLVIALTPAQLLLSQDVSKAYQVGVDAFADNRWDTTHFASKRYPVELRANWSYKQYAQVSPEKAAKLNVDVSTGNSFLAILKRVFASERFTVVDSDTVVSGTARSWYLIDFMVLHDPGSSDVDLQMFLYPIQRHYDGTIEKSLPAWGGHFRMSEVFLKSHPEVVAANILKTISVEETHDVEQW